MPCSSPVTWEQLTQELAQLSCLFKPGIFSVVFPLPQHFLSPAFHYLSCPVAQ